MPSTEIPAFRHETLDVYQQALRFVTCAHEIQQRLPPGRGGLSDQLERAAASIVLNLAEGCGESSRGDKIRFFRMALRSVAECSAILDVARRQERIAMPAYDDGKQLLARLAAMLQAMMQHR